MKVVVKDYLNVRVGKPSLNAPCYQYVAPGTELEVDGVFYEGDIYDGSNKWLKDEAGNHYWAGAVHGTDEVLLPVTAKTNVKFNYNNLINLSDEIKSSKGAGVRICVMDTGCIRHKVFEGKEINFYNSLTNKSGEFGDDSDKGHGTFVSSLICANENSANEIIGIAPASLLQVIRVAEENDVSTSDVLNALKWLSIQNPLPHILNLSFDLPSDKDIAAELEKLSLNGVIIIAAGQNDDSLFNDQDIFYPAAEDSVIAVGALNANQAGKKISKKIKYIVPNLSYRSASNLDVNYYIDMHGCSFSCAIVSGAIALIRSHYGITDKNEIIQKLSEQLETMSSFNNTTLKIYKNEN